MRLSWLTTELQETGALTSRAQPGRTHLRIVFPRMEKGSIYAPALNPQWSFPLTSRFQDCPGACVRMPAWLLQASQVREASGKKARDTWYSRGEVLPSYTCGSWLPQQQSSQTAGWEDVKLNTRCVLCSGHWQGVGLPCVFSMFTIAARRTRATRHWLQKRTHHPVHWERDGDLVETEVEIEKEGTLVKKIRWMEHLLSKYKLNINIKVLFGNFYTYKLF